MAKLIFFIGILTTVFSCSNKEIADLVIINGDVYTVEANPAQCEAIAVKNGIIIKLGYNDDVKVLIGDNTEVIDAKGSFVMPGFIEGHGHFSALGKSLQILNFIDAHSWEEIVEMVERKSLQSSPGEWIVGRGWHQEKWDSLPLHTVEGYPIHKSLSEVTPKNPVVLYHASGHSLYANEMAMKAAGISREIPDPFGGRIVRDKNGDAIGVFEERAMDFISAAYQEYAASLSNRTKDSLWDDLVDKATKECLRKGITSFQDAGSKFEELEKYRSQAERGELGIRLWAMVRHNSEELRDKLENFKVVGAGNGFYTCNAIKSEVDGALGAYGAWLLRPYNDKPGFIGQNTTDIYEVKRLADLALAHNMQFCVHAIGDRANRVVLDIYEGVMDQHPDKKDLRWRIEHAQHLSPDDIPRFKKREIIASMQGIHCTSDAPFVEKRLGYERAKYGSYPWRSLLDAGVLIANGTDAPVEDVDPIPSFYASVTRKRIDNGLEFFPEQSMKREEAIYSYTLGNAYAAFEENIKGSIKVGKYADLVILSKNLLTCKVEEIPDTRVLYTILNGKIVYQSI